MEGGLTFLPHPCVVVGKLVGWVVGGPSGVNGASGCGINEGGADTTAVVDIPVVVTFAEAVVVVSTDAPIGRRIAEGFDFWMLLRRTGAKASAADHPSRLRDAN
jgi:hypothetical protein